MKTTLRMMSYHLAACLSVGFPFAAHSASSDPTPKASAAATEGFGGQPVLGPNDDFRHLFKPYDLVKLNFLGANYCENLLDMRVNTIAYTHRDFHNSEGDAWNLQFPDDTARMIEAITWEDEYSPVVRLEFARRMVKGLITGRIPGAFADSFFRHRSSGKTFFIMADPKDPEGRVDLAMWGDSIENSLKIGFRVERDGAWTEMNAHTHENMAGSPLTAGEARSARWWNASPVAVQRRFVAGNETVDFKGRYWFSDEDRPLEFSFSAPNAERLQIVIGDPKKAMHFLGNPEVPTVLHLPDGKETFSSKTSGDKIFEAPKFNYLVLTKPGDQGVAIGYSKALLVIWEGSPERVEALSQNGYGEVRVTYKDGPGKVWLYPYYHLDNRDLKAIFRSAQNFIDHGRLLQNGYPSQQFINAIPAGLAAGAYLLTRYNDPLAQTARVNAARMVDRLFAAEEEGQRIARVFFTVKAAAWMLKTEKLLGNEEGIRRYSALLDRAMARMCSAQGSYDGKAWPDGWTHFNSMKACWLAYDAIGNPKYLDAYERALAVYSIDPQGIYRNGQKLVAPGGFETYSGALPLAVWGHTGKADWVNQLINLNVPNGWIGSSVNVNTPLSEIWSDAGAGPWAQADANPEYVGFSLKGANLPFQKKYILPVGAFPSYDSKGNVEVSFKPILKNPFFLPGHEPLKIVNANEVKQPHLIEVISAAPGTEEEKKSLVQVAGQLTPSGRVSSGTDQPLIYQFATKDARGLWLDLRIQGDGYRVEVSPDGKNWFERLDSWSDKMADESLDLSFLSGSQEELLLLKKIAPPDDQKYLIDGTTSKVENEHSRYVPKGSSITYKLDFPNAVGVWLELMLANGYRVETSSDGKTWKPAFSANDRDGGNGTAIADETWVRMLDVSHCLKDGPTVYLRISDAGDSTAFEGRTASIRRIHAYGYLLSDQAWVRLSNVSNRAENSFTLENIALRKQLPTNIESKK